MKTLVLHQVLRPISSSLPPSYPSAKGDPPPSMPSGCWARLTPHHSPLAVPHWARDYFPDQRTLAPRRAILFDLHPVLASLLPPGIRFRGETCHYTPCLNPAHFLPPALPRLFPGSGLCADPYRDLARSLSTLWQSDPRALLRLLRTHCDGLLDPTQPHGLDVTWPNGDTAPDRDSDPAEVQAPDPDALSTLDYLAALCEIAQSLAPKT